MPVSTLMRLVLSWGFVFRRVRRNYPIPPPQAMENHPKFDFHAEGDSPSKARIRMILSFKAFLKSASDA